MQRGDLITKRISFLAHLLATDMTEELFSPGGCVIPQVSRTLGIGTGPKSPKKSPAAQEARPKALAPLAPLPGCLAFFYLPTAGFLAEERNQGHSVSVLPAGET
jgi:hypothetical protein